MSQWTGGDAGAIPNIVENVVPRPELWARLDGAEAAVLILVCAPGGYGKTTTVASWLAGRREEPATADALVAWCSLDSLDSDLHRFVSRLVAAVNAFSPGACDQTRHLLEGRLEVHIPYLARQFVEDVAQLHARVQVVLDDYHLIVDPQVHTFVEQVVHQSSLYNPLPPLTLIILSRNTLPFSMARLQGQRRSVELRMQDLQMNSAESEQMLSTLLAKPLSADAVVLLQEYVEGWAAGINLLALSLRNQPDVGHWLAAMGKRPSQYIADYFMDEVLSRQPADVQIFLRTTSLLPVLEPSLCAAALGDDNAERSRFLLNYVVRNNLFVVPVDEVPGGCRYHDLFQAMLQGRLRQASPPDAIDAMHRRIAQRYAEQGDLERAIEGYLAGHAPEQAAAVLEAQVPALLDQEQWQLLQRFLRRLPGDLVAHNPALLLAQGWIYDFYLYVARLRPLLSQVRALLAALAPEVGPARHERLQSELDLLSIAPHLQTAALEETRRIVASALANLPADDLFLRSKALLFLARQYQRHGMIDDALDRLAEELSSAAAQSVSYATRLSFARHLVLIVEGRFLAAEQTIEFYLRLADKTGLPSTIGNARMIAALLYYALCDDDQAIAHCCAALAQPFQSNITNRDIVALHLIDLYAQAGDTAAAVQVAADYAALAAGIGDAETAANAQMLEAAARVFTGQAPSAQGWLNSLKIDGVSAIRPYEGWVWGCGMLALGTPEALASAAGGLTNLIARCEAIHFRAWTAKLLTVLARVYAKQGQLASGAVALCEAVRLSDLPSLQRGLLDQDPLLDRLVAQALQIPRDETDPDGADLYRVLHELQSLRRLSAARDGAPVMSSAGLHAAAYPDPALPPPEPLTARELEILRLLDARRSSKEISSQLNISVNTVRNHTARIYEKLAVDGWLAATQRARALGLLPR